MFQVGQKAAGHTCMENIDSVDMNAHLRNINVAALLFIRAINAKLVFQLQPYRQIPSLFSDIILKLGKQTLFLHLRDYLCHNKNINNSHIFQLKGDFSLLKYYKSFCQMKNLWNHNENLQNYGRFEDSIFVVYTNAVMCDDTGSSADYTLWQELLCTRGKGFNFSEDKFPGVYEIFKNLERYKQLLVNSPYNLQPANKQELLGFIRKVWDSRATTLPRLSELNKLTKELKELGDSSYYKEFLSRFWFLTGQGINQELEEEIQQQIELACGTPVTNLVYARFKKQMQDWYKHSNQVLTQSHFWKDITSGNGGSKGNQKNQL
jgi:hypothetical protein